MMSRWKKRGLSNFEGVVSFRYLRQAHYFCSSHHQSVFQPYIFILRIVYRTNLNHQIQEYIEQLQTIVATTRYYSLRYVHKNSSIVDSDRILWAEDGERRLLYSDGDKDAGIQVGYVRSMDSNSNHDPCPRVKLLIFYFYY